MEMRKRRIARYKMGNKVKEEWYWLKERKRVCRVCEHEKESWEHIWKMYGKATEEVGSWQENVTRILSESREGEEWLVDLDW